MSNFRDCHNKVITLLGDNTDKSKYIIFTDHHQIIMTIFDDNYIIISHGNHDDRKYVDDRGVDDDDFHD